MGTRWVRKFAHARHFLKLCKYCLRSFPHGPENPRIQNYCSFSSSLFFPYEMSSATTRPTIRVCISRAVNRLKASTALTGSECGSSQATHSARVPHEIERPLFCSISEVIKCGHAVRFSPYAYCTGSRYVVIVKLDIRFPVEYHFDVRALKIDPERVPHIA